MKLQTKIPLEKQSNSLIDYSSNILLLGSCFVENIGEKLEYFKFKNLQNPFGILFHSKALETLIVNAIEEKTYSEKDIFFHNEQWHCFDVHSKFSNHIKDDFIDKLNIQVGLINKQIHESTHIIITLGTAWVYRFKESNQIVANCHKVPQKLFEKELLSIDTIRESLERIISNIKKVNSNAQVIFTVSPIRHVKDGFVENTRSKAHLVSAIHQILSPRAKSRGLSYFPSYELMMDELRDYRFYADDMLHPNNTAIDYIWEAFKNTWISKDAIKSMDEIDEIQKGMLHKPFNSSSEAHIKFLQKLEEKKNLIKAKHPHVVF